MLAGSEINRYIKEISRYPVLAPDEEQRLAIRYHDSGDLNAARELVLGNLRFALKIAMEYARFAPAMDLVQEANLGLMEAVRRFDPYRGYRLISYAVWWIRAYVQRFIVENASVVRRGTTRAERKVARKLTSTRRQIEQQTGAAARPAEIAAELDVPEEAVLAVAQRRDVSLDVPRAKEDGEEGSTLAELLPSTEPDVEAQLIDAETDALARQALEDVFSGLDEREREILAVRLLATDPATLQDLAEKYDISRERVRQIEAALRRKVERAVREAVSPQALPAAKAHTLPR
jgi:RNA polymerase sigma-32 factor